MAMTDVRKWLRWRYLLIGVLCIGAALWLGSRVQFRVFQARAVQQRLFGKQIAPWSSLQHAYNGCCAMDASGILEWRYVIPDGQAASLARRCRLPNGQLRRSADDYSPYFDEHSKQCVVAWIHDEANAEDLTAEVAGRLLTIRLFYNDPDLSNTTR